jgi:hypothetical protein
MSQDTAYDIAGLTIALTGQQGQTVKVIIRGVEYTEQIHAWVEFEAPYTRRNLRWKDHRYREAKRNHYSR